MKVSMLAALAILFTIFTGCSGSKITGLKESLRMGYSKKLVNEIMGRPTKIEKEKSINKWYYKNSESVVILFFEDDKLTIFYNREL